MFRPLTQRLHRLSLVLPSTVARQAVPETNAMTKTQLWFCLSNQMKLKCLRETSVLPRDKSHVIRRISRALPYFEFSFVLSVHIIALLYPLLLDRESQQQPAYIYKTKQIQIFCLGVNRVNRHPGACEFPLWGISLRLPVILLRCLTLEALEAQSSLRNAYLYTECVAQVEQGCFAQRDNSHWCLDSISALYIYIFVAELLICFGLWKWDNSFYINYA